MFIFDSQKEHCKNAKQKNRNDPAAVYFVSLYS